MFEAVAVAVAVVALALVEVRRAVEVAVSCALLSAVPASVLIGLEPRRDSPVGNIGSSCDSNVAW